VVVKAGQTTKDQLTKSLGNIQKVHATILGTLLNCVPAKEFDGYSYYTPESDAEESDSAQDADTAPAVAEPENPPSVPHASKDSYSRSATSF
jgi:receptor protein-tyrosine kinase